MCAAADKVRNEPTYNKTAMLPKGYYYTIIMQEKIHLHTGVRERLILTERLRNLQA